MDTTTARLPLRELREARGFSRARLARVADCSEKSVWRAEQGIPLSRLTAGRIAHALGVTPDDIAELAASVAA